MDERQGDPSHPNDDQYSDEPFVTYETGEEPETPSSDDRLGGLSLRTKGIITAAIVLLYLLLPTDVIPDAMIGLGQIDDAIVFATGVVSIISRLRRPKG